MANKGFDGRVFLTEAEHETYLRRMPVRYTKKAKQLQCSVCGLASTSGSPLENAHRIPFGIGVKLFKFTPDYLDSPENLVTAHRGACNKLSELSLPEITAISASLRQSDPESKESF